MVELLSMDLLHAKRILRVANFSLLQTQKASAVDHCLVNSMVVLVQQLLLLRWQLVKTTSRVARIFQVQILLVSVGCWDLAISSVVKELHQLKQALVSAKQQDTKNAAVSHRQILLASAELELIVTYPLFKEEALVVQMLHPVTALLQIRRTAYAIVHKKPPSDPPTQSQQPCDRDCLAMLTDKINGLPDQTCTGDDSNDWVDFHWGDNDFVDC